MKSIKPSCTNSAELSIWGEVKAYSLVFGNWGCGEDEGTGAVRWMQAMSSPSLLLHLRKMNILPFVIISVGTVGHSALPVTKLGLSPMWCFCLSPSALFVSALLTVLPAGSPTVGTSNISASICRVRADALAGLGAIASGKQLLINQIRHVIALITINILDRDDKDAVQSLSDSKYTHMSQHSRTQSSGHPCSLPNPPGLATASSSHFAPASGILSISFPLPAPGFTLPVCLPPSSLSPAYIPCFSLVT